MTVGLLTADARAQVGGKWVTLTPFPDPAEELFGVSAAGVGCPHDAFEFADR